MVCIHTFSNIDFNVIEDILHHFPQVQPGQLYFTKTIEKLSKNSHKHFYDNWNNHQIKLYASPIY